MTVHSGKTLAEILRQMCDAVQHRLWIASPYVGSFEAIRCVLGREWSDHLPKDSVRMLTDAEEGNLNITSISAFRAKGPVKHLRGLHAKLYIIDDQVLLTSANLTRTAFSCRHEVGVVLTGQAAKEAIAQFERWWISAKDISTQQIKRIASKHGHNIGENNSQGLPQLHKLPPDPGGITVHQIFADYEPFRTVYDELAREYATVGHVWPTIPLYLEVDGFLNYLFHHKGKLLSRPYTEKACRQLTAAKRRDEIAKYAREFRKNTIPSGGDSRLKRATQLQGFLAQNRIRSLTKKDIGTVLGILNCMNDKRVKLRVLEGNSVHRIRSAWYDLFYASSPLPERMSTCATLLFGFKRSSVQELLGWYDPLQYPIRNANTNAGMRFLGYDVSAD
jgi:hypothetical protein